MGNHSQFLKNRQPTGAAIVRLACGAVLLGLLFWAWYSWLADYGYSAVSGTYVYHDQDQGAMLILYQNRVFDEELTTSDGIKRTRGSWERSGEAGVAFSGTFSIIKGQRPVENGHVWGHVRKALGGLDQSIVFHGDDREDGPVFKKKLFR